MPAELMLRKKPLATGFACGAQLNHNVFAPQTIELGAPEPSFPDLEDKVKKLEPQLVRIFYNDHHAGVPFAEGVPASAVNARQDDAQKARWQSFLRVVQLAQDAGASINITWQGGDAASPTARDTNMTRFANVLEILAKRPIPNLRWVTIANEPNTVPDPNRPSNITPATLADMYRRLDRRLEERGIRKQIGLMGGDVIEGPRDPSQNRLHQPSPFNQLRWLRFMSANLGGIIDAYSVHIYWDYFDVPKIKRRLDGVLKVIRQLDRERHLAKPMRVFVTEFGTRGKGIDKEHGIDPGRYLGPDGGSMRLCESNIAAFQHAWFLIYAAQLGYAGVVKWDCYYGRYDLIRKPKAPPKGNQQYFAIDKPDAGTLEWQLLPTYFLLRLVTATTERGWQPRLVDPVSGPKRLVAFQGAGKNLTILGLHIGGAGLNVKSGTQVSYSIGGLPPRSSFQLLLWNEGGGGRLVRRPAPVVADAGGVATLTAPLHSVFALTTKQLPESLV